MIKYLIIVLLFFLLGCGKHEDPMSFFYGYWINKSNHLVVIYPYRQGTVVTQNIVSLNPGDSIKIADYFMWGSNKDVVALGSDHLNADSILVLFDSQFSVTHYRNNTFDTSYRYYPYVSDRNLFNITSYKVTTTPYGNGKTNKIKYYFTDLDFFYSQ